MAPLLPRSPSRKLTEQEIEKRKRKAERLKAYFKKVEMEHPAKTLTT